MKEDEIKYVFEKVSNTISLKEIFDDGNVGSRAIWSMITELSFLLTPLLLIAFILVLQNKISMSHFFGLSDITLLSTFIFGQSAIKAFQFPLDTFVLKGNEIITGVITLVVCFGVLPSAVVFSLVSTSTERSTFILWLQPALLIISICTYSLFAFVSNASNIIKTEGAGTIVAKVLDELNGNKN